MIVNKEQAVKTLKEIIHEIPLGMSYMGIYNNKRKDVWDVIKYIEALPDDLSSKVDDKDKIYILNQALFDIGAMDSETRFDYATDGYEFIVELCGYTVMDSRECENCEEYTFNDYMDCISSGLEKLNSKIRRVIDGIKILKIKGE